MIFISNENIELWASSFVARSEFPGLIRDLITASIKPTQLRMPYGPAVWMPGCDGELQCDGGNEFIPSGSSVWELGTNDDCKSKANEDFKKRSYDETGEPKVSVPKTGLNEIFFVFVTPRLWPDKKIWEKLKKDTGIWKDVIAIDQEDLKNWLAKSPSVSLKFAAKQGIVPPGLLTPDDAWTEWSNKTKVPTSSSLAIAGRDEQVKETITRLSHEPSLFTVRADSPREAWGFVLAAIQSIEPAGDRESIYSRVIVADHEGTAKDLRYFENIIIVLKEVKGQVSDVFTARGCHLVMPEGNHRYPIPTNSIKLSRPGRSQFADALVGMGILPEQSEKISRDCRQSLTIFQRMFAHSPEIPIWSTGEYAIDFIPALFAGQWSHDSESDKEIIALLCNKESYSSAIGVLQKFITIEESPLRKISDMWTVASIVDAFELLASKIRPDDLLRFRNAFRMVFGRIDPKVEIPPDEWIAYDIKGEKGYSGWLRAGMAEILLLMVERGKEAGLLADPSPEEYASDVVAGIPGLNNDWRVLASIRDVYPRLMEAAPRPLLDSLEHLLEASPESVGRLFAEGSGVFGGGAMHTGLLWGLETLAWMPEYLTRVSLVLAKLASIDPGGKLVNRPINSLRNIFLWWLPGTTASNRERVDTLNLIIEAFPSVGWELMSKLLPKSHQQTSSGTAKPRWSDVGELHDDSRRREGQIQYVNTIIDIALDILSNFCDRWNSILDSFGSLNNDQRMKAISLLDAISRSQISESDRYSFWIMLHGFVVKHRSFHDATWALPATVLDELEPIVAMFESDNPIQKNRWLFDEWLPDIATEERNLESRTQKVESLRNDAIRSVLAVFGSQGIVDLGVSCKFPGAVARSVVNHITAIDDVKNIVALSIERGARGIELGGLLSGQAFERFAPAWQDWVLSEVKINRWSPSIAASLLAWWPDNRSTWDVVANLGEQIAGEYWKRKHIFVIEGDPDDIEIQIVNLIRFGRSIETFDRLAMKSSGVSSDLLLKVFDAAFKQLGEVKDVEDVRRIIFSSYDVQQFLETMRSRTDISRDDIARREYIALPLLSRHEVNNLTLHRFMADDPKFFVELLCSAFLPKDIDRDRDPEPTQDERERAKSAYTLLSTMHIIPGTRSDGSIDEKYLRDWIDRVSLESIQQGRKDIAEIFIGHILAHAPHDIEDGAWPHRSVRNVIESLNNPQINSGIRTERINMRGTYSKSLYEGGAQERKIAETYRGWADKSRSHWPRVARFLEFLAEGWEADAKREDDEAEKDKLR